MNYNLTIAKVMSELLETTLIYIILFITVLTAFTKGIPTPYCLFGIPFILICYLFIQNYCYHPFLYVILHSLFFIPALLIRFPHPEYRYLYIAMLLIENVHAVLIWKRTPGKTQEHTPYFSFTVVTLVYMIASGYHLTDFATLIYYLGIGLILLYFIRFFIASLNRLFTKSNQATSMPVIKIILTNTYVFLLFLLIFAILTILVRSNSVDEAFAIFGQLLKRIARLLFRVIFYIVTLIKALFATESQVHETQEAEENIGQAFGELYEPSFLTHILDGIITLTTICFIAYCIYRAIVTLIQIFSKRYIQDSDTVIKLTKSKEITKVTESKPSILEKIKDFFRNDNASKVRRGYRLKIKSYKAFTYKEQDTPMEIAEHIHNLYDEDIEELTAIYEKARYSNEEITFDDVQKGGIL